MQFGENPARRRGVAHQAGLGDLDGQPAQREAALIGLAQHRQQRRRVVELARRGVDADPVDDVPAVQQAPRFDLADGLANDPAADRDDQTAFLQQRYEGVGRHQTVARVVPPQQRLGADHPIVGKLDDRLIMEPQLAPADGFGVGPQFGNVGADRAEAQP